MLVDCRDIYLAYWLITKRKIVCNKQKRFSCHGVWGMPAALMYNYMGKTCHERLVLPLYIISAIISKKVVCCHAVLWTGWCIETLSVFMFIAE